MANALYKKPITFAIVATVVVLIGTIVTMVLPIFTEGMNPKLATLKPYSAVELAGRDIYQREGCVNCHTQMVRPLMFEIQRYVDDLDTYKPSESYSLAGEQAYERPFLWGSKRTGPDLARIRLRYNFEGGEEPIKEALMDPQAFLQAPINMPKYKFLADEKVDADATRAHMKGLGFPYSEEEIAALGEVTELDALAAYLMTLGRAIVKE